MQGPGTTQPPVIGSNDGGGGKDPRQLWDYWRVVWEGRRVLAASIGVTVLVAVLGTIFLLPDLYKATALIELRPSVSVVIGTAAERSQSLHFAEQNRAFKTEFVRMRSRAMVQRAIDEHDLLERVPFLAGVPDPVEMLRRMTRVEGRSQTNLAELTVTARAPDHAALLANALAETYAQSDIDRAIARYEENTRRLATKLAETRETLRARYQQQIQAIDDELPLDRLLTLPALETDEALAELRGQREEVQQELMGLRQTYGGGHPQVREARGRLAEIEQQVTARLSAIRSSLAAKLDAAGGPLAEDQLRDVEELAATVSEETATKLLENQDEQRILAELAEPKAVIMDPALPPREPSSPSLPLNLALALVVGAGFGGGILFFRDYLDVSVKTLEDVERDVGLPLLAVIPRARDRGEAVMRESFQTLRTGIVFASRARKDRVLLVTSSGPQEGKSSVALDLATSLASSGDKVVLIDADLRRPAISRTLGMERRPGLSSHLAGAAREGWESLLQPAGKDGAAASVRVLPSGPIPPNPVDLLGTPAFAELLAEAKSRHDWVVVDSPPASSVSDAMLAGSLADMALLVIRHDQTDREVARRSAMRLQSVGTNLVGAVLNDVDMAKSYNRDYFFGRFWYGHYYGDEAPATA